MFYGNAGPLVAAQDATEDEEAADEDLGDDVIAEDDDEAEVEDDENTELVRSVLVLFLFCLFVIHHKPDFAVFTPD